MLHDPGLIAALRWQVDMGADEAVGDLPVDRFVSGAPDAAAFGRRAGPPATEPAAPAPPAPASPAPASQPPSPRRIGPVPPAAADLEGIDSLEALRARVEAFDGCPLKATASRTVFGVGSAGAALMLIGEAPGAEEDRQGMPFVGPSGQLLDRMLATIGLSRDAVYIANIVYWRPPGNRTPTPLESAACLPFLQRQIELVAPAVLVLIGNPSTKAMLGRSDGITRLRGQWFEYATPRMERPLPTMPTFHPAYLLRSPSQKRESWRDLLAIRDRIDARDSALASNRPINR